MVSYAQRAHFVLQGSKLARTSRVNSTFVEDKPGTRGVVGPMEKKSGMH